MQILLYIFTGAEAEANHDIKTIQTASVKALIFFTGSVILS